MTTPFVTLWQRRRRGRIGDDARPGTRVTVTAPNEPMRNLPGRGVLLAALARLVDAGSTVILYGPIGAGKTSVLRWLQARAQESGRPCGVSSATETLGDMTSALVQAYPHVEARSGTMRQVRARLRSAMEQAPGLVLLDQLGNTGTAFKGALKSMRGTGVGVVLAVDVEQPRDHDRVRSLRLTHHEVAIPPLHGSTMRAVLKSLVAEAHLPVRPTDEDLGALVAATDGLPGRAVWFVNALKDRGAWRGSRPRCDWLRTGAIIAATERYRRAVR
jgi:hypothetical protein